MRFLKFILNYVQVELTKNYPNVKVTRQLLRAFDEYRKNNELNTRYIRKFAIFILKGKEDLSACETGEQLVKKYHEFEALAGLIV